MTTQSEEWGPWIEHDGKSCPVAEGTFVQVDVMPHSIIGYGRFCEFKVCKVSVNWIGWHHVARYRIRKPRGMVILEGLLEQIGAPKPCEVPA